MGGNWNFADVWEIVADCIPTAPALIVGDRITTWADFDRRADGIAALLHARGAQHRDKIAQYLYNCPEYLESTFAAFKIGLVPVNTNYRYTRDELVYLWDNADVTTVVFHGAFAAQCAEVAARVPRVTTWLWVDDGSGPCPDWAVPYEDAANSMTDPAALAAAASGRGTAGEAGDTSAASGRGTISQPWNGGASTRQVAPWGRSGDDIHIQYTGGTTGSPKGVMWRQDDLMHVIDNVGRTRLPAEVDLDVVRRRTVQPGPRNLAVAPLMHGTALLNAFTNLLGGGSVVCVAGRSFDAAEVLDAIDHNRIGSMAIAGDVFAKPLLATLDASPGRWDISSLRVVTSSGVMLSQESKAQLLALNPRIILIDGMGSTEAFAMAVDVTTAASAPAETARFTARPGTLVLDSAGHPVVPGSGERGLLAQRGRMPVGYYKDPAKTAVTFPVYDGVRYTMPGDWAEVDANASTPAAKRCTPKRSRKPSKPTPRFSMPRWSACPTTVSANVSSPSSSAHPGSGSIPGPLRPTSANALPATRCPSATSSLTPSAARPTANSTTAP
jgi:3-oxocholest-4-en-26-oate---CoA ligase